MREVGSVRTFETGTFEVVENNIIKNKDKNRFIIKLNLYALLFSAIGIVLTFLVIPKGITISIGGLDLIFMALYFLSFLVFIVVHEWLHGISFRIWNKNTKEQIKFGIVLKSGMAYCISTIPVKVGPSRISLMMPVYAVCIPMYILALVFQDVALGILAILFLSGSVGDFYYMWKLRKTNKDLYMYEEMPSNTGYEVGYILYKKID